MKIKTFSITTLALMLLASTSLTAAPEAMRKGRRARPAPKGERVVDAPTGYQKVQPIEFEEEEMGPASCMVGVAHNISVGEAFDIASSDPELKCFYHAQLRELEPEEVYSPKSRRLEGYAAFFNRIPEYEGIDGLPKGFIILAE